MRDTLFSFLKRNQPSYIWYSRSRLEGKSCFIDVPSYTTSSITWGKGTDFVVVVLQYHRLITSSSTAILPPVYSSSGVFIDYPYYSVYQDLASSSLAGLCPLPRCCLCMADPASHPCSCRDICIIEPGWNGSLKIRGGKRLEKPKAGKNTVVERQIPYWDAVPRWTLRGCVPAVPGLSSHCGNVSFSFIYKWISHICRLLAFGPVLSSLHWSLNICCGCCAAPSAWTALILLSRLPWLVANRLPDQCLKVTNAALVSSLRIRSHFIYRGKASCMYSLFTKKIRPPLGGMNPKEELWNRLLLLLEGGRAKVPPATSARAELGAAGCELEHPSGLSDTACRREPWQGPGVSSVHQRPLLHTHFWS